MKELSDADVFGAPASREMSDADVFGAPKDMAAARRPTIADMRSLALPGYAAARTAEQARRPETGLGAWETQLVRNLGVNDELNGGIAYGVQGAKNLIRRVTGQPVAIPAGVAGQAAMDYDREQQQAYAQQHPGLNTAATLAGIAVSGKPGAAPMTPMSAMQAGRTAAAVQAPFALARQKGTIPQRLPGAALDTAIAFGTGAGLQAAGNSLAGQAVARRAAPRSDARQLADLDVTLTPGEMAGGLAQRAEDAFTSTPIVGDAIRSAKIRGLESFDRAGYNQALGEIGETLPKNVNVGRDAVAYTHGQVGAAYGRALNGVSVAPDAPWAALTDPANVPNLTKNLSADAKGELLSVLDDVTSRFSGPVTGEEFKAIDADLGAASRAARAGSATKPGYSQLAKRLDGIRGEFNDVLGRVNPGAAAEKAKADAAHALLIRLRDASESLGAKGGVFTAPQLQRAVRSADASPWAFSEGDALMQNLSEPGSKVLSQTVPDSGTPFRSLLATLGGLGGTVAGGAAVGAGPVTTPAAAGIAGVMGAGAALYSRPAQAALNGMYRWAGPGRGVQSLSTLAELAAKNPAFVPLYRAALQQAGALFPGVGGQQIPQQAQPAPTQ